jgi:hypothetical protein
MENVVFWDLEPKMEAIHSSETLGLITATRRHIPEDGILLPLTHLARSVLQCSVNYTTKGRVTSFENNLKLLLLSVGKQGRTVLKELSGP